MGIQHLLLLLLLIYLDPLCASKKGKHAPRRSGKVKELNGTATATGAAPIVRSGLSLSSAAKVGGDHDTCLGYYDVSGQYDKEFACNNTDHRYCCGSCFLRFCCPVRAKRLEQRACTNYNTPDWVKTQPPSPAPTADTYDPALDRTNTTVYITCGAIAFILLMGIGAKVAYDKATRPPQEMNVHRALADILRQQGPVSASQFDEDNMATIEGSPKENTPIRSNKNHYTPVHNKINHGHHGKDNYRAAQDMHNFISSGFVTLGRGQLKAQHSVDDMGWQGDLDIPLPYNNHHHNYTSHVDLTGSHTPKIGKNLVLFEKPRKNNILTSQTEPYDISFSRSYQNLTHLFPSYEVALKSDLGENDFDTFYRRKLHLSDVTPKLVKLAPETPVQRVKPRRVQRAMSQDHVLSPVVSRRDYAVPVFQFSQDHLLSTDRLQSRDPLLSPDKLLSLRRADFREKSMARALSQIDMFVPMTPSTERHNRMAKAHSHSHSHSQPSDNGSDDGYRVNDNFLSVSGTKRQAFASRRTHTVDHLQYIPGHHHHQYRTASKNEVTV
ncbi:protein shisa-6-like [Trichomycterus rosablanca]|uniref:protein shisa-6-like n=1 Tax=Trichomycterus rosablanca TaxID=2290929 RepID=UPI002F354FBA